MDFRTRRVLEKKNITLVDGMGRTTTVSGKNAFICQNDTNISRPLFKLYVDGNLIFARGGIDKVIEKINEL